MNFWRRFLGEFYVQGQLQELALFIAASGPLDAESGMSVDLLQMDQAIQQALQNLRGKKFSELENLAEGLWKELESRIPLAEIKIKTQQEECRVVGSLNSGEAKKTVENWVLRKWVVNVEGQERCLESAELQDQNPSVDTLMDPSKKWKNWSELLNELELQAWQGELRDALNEKVYRIHFRRRK